jgi:hypothetical protein
MPLTAYPGSGRAFGFPIVPTEILVAMTWTSGLVDITRMHTDGGTRIGATVGLVLSPRPWVQGTTLWTAFVLPR